MKSKSRLILITFIAVLAVSAYAVSLWFIYTLNHSTGILAKETVEGQQKVTGELSLKKLADDIRPGATKLSNLIVAKDGDVAFIEFLEGLSKERGVNLSIVSVKENQGADWNELAFQLTAEASWGKLEHFLELIEVMPYQVSIQSVGFSLVDSTKGNIKGSIKESKKNWRLALEISVSKEK